MNDKEIEKRFENIKRSRTFRNILNMHDLGRKSVLDIGSSYGEFLNNFGENSVGLTISKTESDYGLSIGLDNRYGNIEDDNLTIDRKFDVIFANNIFEHLYSPHGFLIKIREFSNKNTKLILGVPVFPRPKFLVNISKFRGSLAHAHINFFTRLTLIETVARSGWIVEEARSYHFSNKFLDSAMNYISPHIYVVAHIDPDFKYHEKRMKELEGYDKVLKS